MARFRNRRAPAKKSEESSEPKIEDTIEETADEAAEETVEETADEAAEETEEAEEEETAMTQEEAVEEAKATPDANELKPEPIAISSEGVKDEDTQEEDVGVEPAEGEQNPEPKQGMETPVSGKKRLKLKKDKADKKDEKKPMAGLIFMCNEKTKQECFKFRIFGLPKGKASVVERVTPGMKLFLFNVPHRQLYGVYEASSPGGLDLDTEAFKESGSDKGFPAQVRFRITKNCLPLSEATFRPAIKENYFKGNKFRNELTAEQVEKLTKLFRPVKEAAKEVAAAAKVSTNVVKSKSEQQLKKKSKQENQESMSGKKKIRSDSRPQRKVDIPQHRQRGGGRAPQPPPQQRRLNRPPRSRPLPAYAANPVVMPRDSYYTTPYAVEAVYAEPTYIQRPVVDPYLEAVSTLPRKRAYEDAYLSSDYSLLAAPKRAHLQEFYPADYSRSAAYSNYLRY